MRLPDTCAETDRMMRLPRKRQSRKYSLPVPDLIITAGAGNVKFTIFLRESCFSIILISSEDNKGIQVYIGNETPVQTMKDCSVVTATYELGEGMQGTIGIIGPKRMDYENVMRTLKTLMVELDAIFHKEH